MKKLIKCVVGILLTAAVTAGAAAVWWSCAFYRPFRVEADCRGLTMDVETMKRWEKQEENGTLGVVNMAGWRVGEQQSVSSVSTKRSRPAQVILVYGSMETAAPAPVIAGRCGMDVEGDFCVLSEGLALHLFGSVDVAGERVKVENQTFLTAGVIGGEEDVLMIPMDSGEIQEVAVIFKGRLDAEERMERLMGR